MIGEGMIKEQELLSLAVYSLRKTGFRYGMHVFISGCDEMACMIGTLARHCGAASVTYGTLESEGKERNDQSCTHCFTYGCDNIETAKRITEGRLYDIVFETTGNSIAYDSFIDLVKRGGVVGILARLEQAHSFFVKTAVRSQIRFIGLKTFDEKSAEVAKELIERDWRCSD